MSYCCLGRINDLPSNHTAVYTLLSQKPWYKLARLRLVYNCLRYIYHPPLVSASHEFFWGYQEIHLRWWTCWWYSLNMGWLCDKLIFKFLQWTNNFFSGITTNWYEEKRIMLVDTSHVIKMIVIISCNWFRNHFSYINKAIIKHISSVLRIVMDNIILIQLFILIFFYRTIFLCWCVIGATIYLINCINFQMIF